MYCVICLDDEPPLYQLGCSCKTTYWHKGCLLSWLKSSRNSNMLLCCICKQKCDKVKYIYDGKLSKLHKFRYSTFFCLLFGGGYTIICVVLYTQYGIFETFMYAVLIFVFLIFSIILAFFICYERAVYPAPVLKTIELI